MLGINWVSLYALGVCGGLIAYYGPIVVDLMWHFSPKGRKSDHLKMSRGWRVTRDMFKFGIDCRGFCNLTLNFYELYLFIHGKENSSGTQMSKNHKT